MCCALQAISLYLCQKRDMERQHHSENIYCCNFSNEISTNLLFLALSCIKHIIIIIIIILVAFLLLKDNFSWSILSLFLENECFNTSISYVFHMYSEYARWEMEWCKSRMHQNFCCLPALFFLFFSLSVQ